MRLFYKFLPIWFLALTAAASDSPSTGVLRGGWPPQNLGKKVGESKVDRMLKNSDDNTVKISDSRKASKIIMETNEVEEKVIGQSAMPKEKLKKKAEEDIKKLDITLLAQAAAAEAKEQPKAQKVPAQSLPEKKNGPSPTLLDVNEPTPPIELPPLPDVVDRLTAVVPQPRAERPERPARKTPRSLYTLGPGDRVTFSAFDRSDLARTVTIGPDGTVSYLQAVAVKAGGLTVDELREKMEDELRQYRRDFKLIINPELMQSKEFAILGRVRTPGTYTLDRPVTVLEGIALAQGIEVGTVRGSAFGLADFGRSFVSRGGNKIDVDFEKLYHEGDLAQNVYLQPNDYIYIASMLQNEIFVLGAVKAPGRIKITNKLTTASAIALAGGFRNDAFRMKVLVLRGDINHPDIHVVNVRDVVRGRAMDFPIKDGDIIFVNDRPTEMLERAVNSAITTYVQTVTTEALNIYYNPLSD